MMAMVFATQASAADVTVGQITIGNPWARATPKGATAGAGYMTITNKGSAPDRLSCVSASDASLCEIHSTTTEDGVSKMRPVADGLEIKPGETVELKPSGFHVMLSGLKQPLLQGKTVKVTFEFRNAGKVTVDYGIQPVGSAGPKAGNMGGMKM
jgi:hypothetical protein